MSIMIRRAESRDVPALVRLRLANAERHVQLAPDIYRIPDAEAVARHFRTLLADESARTIVSVAELDGDVVGMTELVLLPEPPDHQILVPRKGADVHTVVLDAHRGHGVGAALLAHTRRLATTLGVTTLHAGIFAPNADAVAFYSACGFTPRGTLLSGAPRPTEHERRRLRLSVADGDVPLSELDAQGRKMPPPD